MAFRADEAEKDGYEQARRVLASTGLDPAQRATAEDTLQELILEHGPVIRTYPTWHPLVPQRDPRHPVTTPGDLCGYDGLDHTVLFAHAFVSCPYDDGARIIESAEQISHRCADITAETLDVTLYNNSSTAILVRCNWHESFADRHMVPKRLAVPLMIEQQMRMWHCSDVGERWETMRPYFLGSPHGSRSSLFVTQKTALAMKRAYMAMVDSGMFGPLHLD